MPATSVTVRKLRPGQAEARPPEEWSPRVGEALRFPPIRVSAPATSRRRATPRRIAVGALADWRVRLVRPLSVSIVRDRNAYIAESKLLREFGFGPSPMDAVDDLRQAIPELYFELKKRSGRLGPDLDQIWRRIRKIIEER